LLAINPEKIQGLWKKTGTYREKPHVVYGGRYLLVIGSAERYFFSSTIPALNKADHSYFVGAQLDYQWIPIDDMQDELQIDIAMPRSNLSINSLVYFIFLNYTLDYHSFVEAEVTLYGSLPLSNSTSSVTIFGRLAADQKLPFRWRENYRMFEPNHRDIEHYSPTELRAES
ncbi:hypothetical protein COOONC_18073, partial [Cooperia oncophora]